MKKVNIEKIKAELENNTFGRKPIRYGIEYSWYNAHALDAGIRTRGNNAIKWRERVVKLSEEGTVYSEKVKLKLEFGPRRSWKSATAYIVNGEDKFYVCRGKMYEVNGSWVKVK